MATRKERINGIDEEIAQLKRRQTLLRQQQNKQDRKDRTHRICKRGGLVESLLPDLARIDDEQFQIFVDKVLLTPHTKRILAELVPPLPKTASRSEDDTSAAETGTATAKPIQSPQNTTTGGNISGGSSGTQTS